MSGGGFRATGFQLGTLAYLNKVELLEKVSKLSTVSGGTFTGASYVLAKIEGQDFEQYFAQFYDNLEKSNLTEKVLDQLGDGKFYNQSGRKSLITAAAQVYATSFFEDTKGQPYRMETIVNSSIHIKDITFNTTEFKTGLNFRFQRTVSNRSYMGNTNFILKEGTSDIRVADVVAASSCFPGGFEPIVFPEDFCWSDQQALQSVTNKIRMKTEKQIPLMDGGVYDNQGIYALKQAIRRDKNHKHIQPQRDLILISDVDSKPETLYELPKIKQKDRVKYTSGLTLGNWFCLITLLFWLGLATVVSNVVMILNQTKSEGFIFWSWSFWSHLLPAFFTAILISATIYLYIKVFKPIINAIPHSKQAAWQDLKKLNRSLVVHLIKIRIESLMALTSLVFMKRIRSLSYKVLFSSSDLHMRVRANLVYDLDTLNEDRYSEFPESIGIIKPDSQLQKVCDFAARMKTTLWWENSYEQPAIVACGQVTTCYNLIRYVYKSNGKKIPIQGDDHFELWQILVADWKAFNGDPYFMLRDNLGSDNVFEYPPCISKHDSEQD